jgi:outer membrane protein OmpA-like peptidoglycan-associated protein
VIVITGCGKFNLNQITYKVVPSPLEYKGDSIEVTITAEYPKKTMPKKAMAEVTPVLKYKGGEKSFKTIKLKGEKSSGEGQTVNHTGGNIKYNAKIPYVDGMQDAELHVKAVGMMKGKEKFSGMTTSPIALGTIITPLLTMKDEQFVLGAHNFGPIFKTQIANIYFPYNSASIRPGEKTSDEMNKMKEFVDAQLKDGATFQSLEINGWASPDGEETKNSELSTKRSDEVKKWMSSYFEKDKKIKGLSLSSKGNGEDTRGFQTLTGSNNFEGKSELISKINSGAKNSDLKKDMAKDSYNYFEKEILSPLRKSEVKLVVQQRQKTNDELINLSKSNPSALTIEELLYTAQTLISDDATKMQVYNSTAQLFPTDWRAYNNMGLIFASQGKINEALTEFQKAEKVSSTEKAIKNNIGAAYMMKGDKTNAMNYYKQGSGSSENGHNLGNLYILQGKYPEAVSSFGNECSFNAALAKVLAGSAEKAGSTIDCSKQKEMALSYYLKAIAAARTNSKQAIIDNLKTAIQKDGSLKSKAKADLEFLKYREDGEFKSVTQ